MVRRTIRLEDGSEVMPGDLNPSPPPRNAAGPAKPEPSKRPVKAAPPKGSSAPDDVIVDPIDAVRGQSTRLGPILRATWPGSRKPYVTHNVGIGLACADGLARARASATSTAPDIDAADLLYGMVAIPKLSPASWMTGFLDALARYAPSPAELPRMVEFNPNAEQALDPVAEGFDDSLLRWDAVILLATASALRRETNRSHQSIGLRHIWFAALFTPEGQRALQALNLLNEGLGPLIEALDEMVAPHRARRYGDSAGAWEKVVERARSQPLLIEPARRARSGFNPDIAIDDTGPPGAPQPDPLGTRADATALADLILLEAAEPPLAVGLFGSWGSGKSTLIRRLKKEIKRQTDEEKKERLTPAGGGAKQEQATANAPDPQTRRVANVAQLEFNAWSFIDSQNLWASLTSEIFEQLRAGGEEEWAKQAGRKLVQEVAAKVSVKEIAASAAKAAAEDKEAALTQAEAELQATVDARANTLSEAAQTVLNDAASPLPAPIAGALRKLFAGDFERNARGQLGKWRSVWSVWRNAQPKRFWLTLGLTALALVLSVAFAFPSVRSAVTGWWASVPGFGLVGALTLALGPLRTIAAAINRYATTVDEKNLTFETEEREKRQAVETARTARDEAVATQSAATGAAAALEETAKDPAKLLTYLLTESADIQTVRSHLGLLGTVRRCFQSLDDLIQQQRDRPHSIDRIVLYIDDLDRCSAPQVVQILEAVHLLLAFKCFVVVVAIDARWLRRSLEISHPQFKSIDGGAADRGSQVDSELPSTSDYLEKIFQIPFWVQGMGTSPSGPAGSSSPYSRYLSQLLGPPPTDEGGGADPHSGKAAGVANAVAFVPEPPAAADHLADEPARAERVQLSRAERDLLDKLGPLAAKSPRAVKRLINIYRLIRARIAQDKETVFLTGGSLETPSFAGVQFALALDSGISAGSVPKVRAGIAAFSDDGWSALAADPTLLDEVATTVFPVVMSHNPDHARFDALKLLLDEAGRRAGFIAALEAVKEACGGKLDRWDIDRAFALTQRYSFRAT